MAPNNHDQAVVTSHLDVHRAQQDTGVNYADLAQEAAAADLHDHNQTFKVSFGSSERHAKKQQQHRTTRAW